MMPELPSVVGEVAGDVATFAGLAWAGWQMFLKGVVEDIRQTRAGVAELAKSVALLAKEIAVLEERKLDKDRFHDHRERDFRLPLS